MTDAEYVRQYWEWVDSEDEAWFNADPMDIQDTSDEDLLYDE